MATPESKERERFSGTTISHGELSGRQQGACGPLMVLTELMTASLQSSSLSHYPAGLLQNWCTQALDNISGFMTAIILYYSLKHFFLSCLRSVKCILAKEKEEIPSPKSFQHRERAVCSSAEPEILHGEKRGGLTAEEHAGGQPALQWPWITAVAAPRPCSFSFGSEAGRWQLSTSNKLCSFGHVRLSEMWSGGGDGKSIIPRAAFLLPMGTGCWRELWCTVQGWDHQQVKGGFSYKLLLSHGGFSNPQMCK